jgi:hypothetical protein
VECWTNDQNKDAQGHYDWKCRISVPNGGLLEITEELSFEAPTEGYRSFDEINMPMNLSSGWQRDTEKRYFLKLADGNYARIKFKMVAHGNHFFRIESYLNPDKSRNLEYDRSKEIEVKAK